MQHILMKIRTDTVILHYGTNDEEEYIPRHMIFPIQEV